jgi:hypothetical protein
MTEQQAIVFVKKVRKRYPGSIKSDLALLDDLSSYISIILIGPIIGICVAIPSGVPTYFEYATLIIFISLVIYSLLFMSKCRAAKNILMKKGSFNFE